MKSWKRLSGLMGILMLAGALIFPGRVMAEGRECTVSIPVSMEVKNAPENAAIMTQIVITAEEPGTPMPQVTSLMLEGGGTAGFGPIIYMTPGDYRYVISQEAGEEDYIYDSSAYRVTVRVVNQNDGTLAAEVWAVRNGTEDKSDEIRFENEYKAPDITVTPKPTVTPEPTVTTKPADRTEVSVIPKGSGKKTESVKTGDETPVSMYVVLFVLSALAAAAVWRKRSKM